MSDQVSNEVAYWSKDVAENLDIGNSTLRKWCIALENNGYFFIRGQNNSRAFTDKDVIALRKMKHLVHEQKMTLENAAEFIVSMFSPTPRTDSVPPEQNEIMKSENTYITKEQANEIIERQKRQEEFNLKLLERLDQQQKYIEDSLIKRDHQLLHSLRETMEVKKMIATSLEQNIKEQKKGFFSFFKRKKEQ